MNHFHSLFRSDLITIFDYCCDGQDSAEDEPTRTYELVFLRSGAFVRRDADGTTVANPNHVVFFQPGRDCRITHPVPGGDHCTVVSVALPQLAEMQRQLARSGQPEKPFPSTNTLVRLSGLLQLSAFTSGSRLPNTCVYLFQERRSIH